MPLSTTSKLGTFSWSLQALETCPGAKDQGKIVEVCQACYARGGNYRFPAVKNVRARNKEEWQQDEWVDKMVSAIEFESHFVWFDSGDAYSLRLLEKIKDVIIRTPHTKHWLRTRMWKFPKFRTVLNKINKLHNAVARFSADNFDEVLNVRFSASVLHERREGVFVCGSSSNGDKCGSCRACWDRSIPIIGYPAHGRAAYRIIKLKEVKNA